MKTKVGEPLPVTSTAPVNLLVHWDVGEQEIWRLATNLADLRMALHYYRRRMWIEEMFGA